MAFFAWSWGIKVNFYVRVYCTREQYEITVVSNVNRAVSCNEVISGPWRGCCSFFQAGSFLGGWEVRGGFGKVSTASNRGISEINPRGRLISGD